MRRKISSVLAIGFIVLAVARQAQATPEEETRKLHRLAELAVSESPRTTLGAIEELRRHGTAGLEALMSVHADEIVAHQREASQRTTAASKDDEHWKRISAAIDAVGAQRDCHASRLFWHTDLEAAKAEARRQQKPILSLRLLGKLSDEYSCANSRFFRSTLYANEEVSQALRARFVLHWQSVRPVPKVTIDFGDGRKLERTLTGNSIHYVLASDGQVIDALPGLYGPKAFLRELANAEQMTATVEQIARPRSCRIGTVLPPSNDWQVQVQRALTAYHDRRATEIRTQWQRDLESLRLMPQDGTAQVAQREDVRQAVAAMQLAAPKGAAAERTVLAGALADASILSAATNDEAWGRIAMLHRDDGELDQASRAFIRSKNPLAARAGERALTKRVVEDPLVRLVATLQQNIAIDTVRNEYTLHRQIHEWFARQEVDAFAKVDALNERVYAQLFLTPSSDPWLGLAPDDAYTALEDNGVIATR